MTNFRADAINRINAFYQRFGIGHFYLTTHAAFPLALTPDLLYRLRAEFRQDCQGHPLNIPWIAVSDLLLSDLCHEVGSELYEMNQPIRQELLKWLQEQSNFSKSDTNRIHELSEFLLRYVQQHLRHPMDSRIQDLAQVQRWTALAYTEPKQLACELTFALSQAYQQDRTNLIRLANLAETFAEPLASYEPLLVVYARAMGKLARGNRTGAEEQFQILLQGNSQIEFAGLTLQVPPLFAFEVVRVDTNGHIVSRTQEQAPGLIEDLGKGVRLEMVAVPGGSFWMGSREEEAGSHDTERPQHLVTVPPFYMSRYPITQAQWRAVTSLPRVNRNLKRDPASFKGDDRPVESVSWLDAVEFCTRLSRKTGRKYRLPSEAEWEYACRAGTTTPFHFGETIATELANYNGNLTYGSGPKGVYREATTPVGSFGVANAFGLYDMHGNVWEWCADHWHDNYEGVPTDGSAWVDPNANKNQYRLLRGGSWDLNPRECRSASRDKDEPVSKFNLFGFRVVCPSERTP